MSEDLPSLQCKLRTTERPLVSGDSLKTLSRSALLVEKIIQMIVTTSDSRQPLFNTVRALCTELGIQLHAALCLGNSASPNPEKMLEYGWESRLRDSRGDFCLGPSSPGLRRRFP